MIDTALGGSWEGYAPRSVESLRRTGAFSFRARLTPHRARAFTVESLPRAHLRDATAPRRRPGAKRRDQPGTVSPGHYSRITRSQNDLPPTGIRMGERAFLPAEAVARVDAAPDWITAIIDEPAAADEAERAAQAWIEEEATLGNKVRPFTVQGYRGIACQSVATGRIGDSVLVQLSGQQAGCRWEGMRSWPARLTRLDVQTTFTLCSPRRQLGRSIVPSTALPTAVRGRAPVRGGSWDSQGMSIRRVGSGEARLHLRVYDKGIEQRDAPAGFRWRVEAQTRREYSERLWKNLTGSDSVQLTCYSYCRSVVRHFGCWWPLATHGAYCSVTAPRVQLTTDDARSLEWLERQVRKTVERLRRHGKGDAAVRALGLTTYEGLGPLPGA